MTVLRAQKILIPPEFSLVKGPRLTYCYALIRRFPGGGFRVQKGFLVSVLIFASWVALTSCEPSKKITSSSSDIELSDRMHMTMDPALSQDERNLLISDLNRTLEFQVQVDPKSFYGKAFGTGDSSGVIQYLSDRVHYIVPESVDLQSRLSLGHDHSTALPLTLQSTIKAPLSDFAAMTSSNLYTMATNVGTVLWFEALAVAPDTLTFTVGDTHVALDSSRVGVVQMGQGYTLKHESRYAFPQLARIATLVHEARHSDCTGGLARADLTKLMDGDMPDKPGCGHLHVRCPAGHNYEGAFACDGEAWGAYAIQALYSAALVQNCSNCTAEEQNQAIVIFSDSLSRVIPVDDMLAGKLGNPDMSSSTVVY